MFDARPQFHEYPDVPGFPAFDAEIASSEMPSGASWLANCLLELGVSLWKPWGADIASHWRACGPRRFRYASKDASWRSLLPSLADGREFAFRAAPVPRVTHAWAGTYGDVPRTILFVRDPRDALHSLWHRARRVGLVPDDQDFGTFLREPWFHYPIGRGDFLLVWLRVWRLALAGREHLVLRYEDYRRDAAGTLRRALAFLRIEAADADVERALAASDFEVARAAEARRDGNAAPTFNRAGLAEEWRETFDDAMHAAVGPRYASLYAWLGYAPDASGLAPPAEPEPDAGWIERMLVAADTRTWRPERAARLRERLIAASMDRTSV